MPEREIYAVRHGRTGLIVHVLSSVILDRPSLDLLQAFIENQIDANPNGIHTIRQDIECALAKYRATTGIELDLPDESPVRAVIEV